MRIDDLEWAVDRIDPVERYNITPEEVEEVCFGKSLVQRAKSAGENPVYYVLGQTEVGRYLFCVVIRFPDGNGYAVTAREMTAGWRHYRYLASNRSLLGPLARMEANVSSRPLYEIPKSQIARIEPKLRSGDIIGIISRDRGGLRSTAHVGLALRTSDGVLHFMHASSPSNYGRVVVDSELSKYLYRYGSDTGILVARPLR